MANRESIGLVAMTLAFVLVVGGVGGFLVLRYVNATGIGDPSVDNLISRGRAAANRRQFEEALGLLGAAVEADPRNPDVYVARGEVYSQIGEHPSAHDDFTAALERGPDTIRALSGRARVREQLTDLEGAIEDYDDLLELDPDHTGALRGRARIHKQTGAYTAAVEDFERAIAIDPGMTRIDSDVAWAYWGAGDYAAALKAYDRAVSARRVRDHDLFGRGVTLYHLDRLPEAREELMRASNAVRSGPDYPRYYLWLTMVKLGERQAADKLLANAGNGRSGRWSRQIGHFLLGQDTEEEFLDQAAAGTWQPANQQLCEAHFYAGALRLIEGDRDAAIDHLRKCVATGVNNFYEYFSAMEELRKLELTAPGASE